MDDKPLGELVEGALNGERAAWDAIVDRYAGLVFAVCRRFRLSEADQYDVSQTVWLHLVEHLPRLRNSEALPGWLATTTRHECLDVVKQETRRGRDALPPDLASPDTVDAEDIDAHLLRAERRTALRRAFAELSEKCQHLLRLLTHDPPTSYEEIGKVMGIPIGSIGPSRARCLARLRRMPALAALGAAIPRLDAEPAQSGNGPSGGIDG
jgi:RNA polymerase sigma factor (sigma-70 family)